MNGRILVVDDDSGLLKLLALRLSGAGHEVQTRESGAEALALLSVFRPHLVITDLRMDGMDGMALFEAIHQGDPTLPVIILTAHGSIPDAVDATRRGVYSYLTKPFDSQQLLAQAAEAVALRGASGTDPGADPPAWRRALITRSPLMEELLAQVGLIAESEANVYIHGESGTGKELLALAVHGASERSEGPFVPVNCSAIPENLFESELFGHARGAFTGAVREHKGLFQSADGGTLFLDEIGDMPPGFQVKLLRALQERAVRPVGALEDLPVDVRVVCASHRNLDEAMEQGAFREDLYYRLNVVRLDLPPLRERREDIPLLASHFLHELGRGGRQRARGFSPEAMELLVSAPWPGNVRQLYNVVEQTRALATTPLIPASLVQRALRDRAAQLPSLVDARNRFERDYLVQLLRITAGVVSRAARLAGRNRTEFYKLLQRHHLNPADFKERPAPPQVD